MSGKELPKIIEKSPAEIEAAIAAIEASNLSTDIKEFATSCVRLAVWLPEALLSHKITLANIRKLVFVQGDKITVTVKVQKTIRNNHRRNSRQQLMMIKIPTSLLLILLSLTLSNPLKNQAMVD